MTTWELPQQPAKAALVDPKNNRHGADGQSQVEKRMHGPKAIILNIDKEIRSNRASNEVKWKLFCAPNQRGLQHAAYFAFLRGKIAPDCTWTNRIWIRTLKWSFNEQFGDNISAHPETHLPHMFCPSADFQHFIHAPRTIHYTDAFSQKEPSRCGSRYWSSGWLQLPELLIPGEIAIQKLHAPGKHRNILQTLFLGWVCQRRSSSGNLKYNGLVRALGRGYLKAAEIGTDIRISLRAQHLQIERKPGHFSSIRTLQPHEGDGNLDALPSRAEDIPSCSYHTLWMQEGKPHVMSIEWVFWPSQSAHLGFSIGCKSGMEVVSFAMWAEIGSCQLIVSSCIISFQFVCPLRERIVGESNTSEDKTMAVGTYRTYSPLPYL